MNNSWEEVFLEDAADELTVGHVGSMTNEYVDSGIPFLRSKNIVPYGIDWSDMKYISHQFHTRLRKSRLGPGDVVIVRTGKPGAATVIPETLEDANCSDLVIIRPNPQLLDTYFLTYYLNSVAQTHISAHLVGAVQQHFNVGSARRLRLRLPSLDEQRAIAEVMRTLDDKIELNRQTNQTLEQLAQRLFQSWFVDFDPVKAKLVGQAPAYMDAETVALFPDRLVESELGLIPKGWGTASFYEAVEVISGGTPKTKIEEYWNGDIPWYSIADAPTVSDVFVVDTEKKITAQGVDNSPAKLVPELTTIISARGTVGRLALTGVPMTFNQSCYGLRGFADDHYYVFFLSRQLVETLRHRAHGAVFSTITRDTLRGLNIPQPPKAVRQAYQSSVDPLLQRILLNVESSKTLAALRDLLLPKLISGQLRVRDAEREVEAVL